MAHQPEAKKRATQNKPMNNFIAVRPHKNTTVSVVAVRHSNAIRRANSSAALMKMPLIYFHFSFEEPMQMLN